MTEETKTIRRRDYRRRAELPPSCHLLGNTAAAEVIICQSQATEVLEGDIHVPYGDMTVWGGSSAKLKQCLIPASSASSQANVLKTLDSWSAVICDKTRRGWCAASARSNKPRIRRTDRPAGVTAAPNGGRVPGRGV
jgi:hypothetical protein